jgi:protein-tyrosine phosphatase
VSFNFSNITDDLFIGTTPLVEDYKGLRELGIRLIINMRFSRGPYPDSHHTPIQLLWLRTIDSPFFPISMAKLMLGAKTALETIRMGGKVYVHCAYGRHRGVAMGACVLIAQGYDPEAAMKLIVERRPLANPNAYYIRPRIMMFARQWNSM